MNLKVMHFPYSNYKFYINSYPSKCHSNHYNGENSSDFFRGMLNLSNYRCFYCGESLIVNSLSSISYEKEHIINKKYFGRNKKTIASDENKALNKCKYNLIPICKTCNSLKKHIVTSVPLVNSLNNLENLDNCKENRESVCSEFLNCFEDFKKENFNPFSQNIQFDILHKIYHGDNFYTSQFRLNIRTKTIFLNIFNYLYHVNFNFSNGGFINYLKSFSRNSLEDTLIDYLKKISIISDYGTVDSKRLNNLIETIILLDEII